MGIMDELYKQEADDAPPSPLGSKETGRAPKAPAPVEPTGLRDLARPPVSPAPVPGLGGPAQLGGSGGIRGGNPYAGPDAPRFQIRGGVEHPKRVRSSSLPMGIVSGLGAATLGGIVWSVIAIQLQVEIGWVAWLLGAFVGFLTVLGARKGGTDVAIAASLLAILGLGIGKHIMLEVGIKGEMRRIARAQNMGPMIVAQQRLTQSGVLQAEMQGMFGGGMDPSMIGVAPAAPGGELSDGLMQMTMRYQQLLQAEAQKVTHAEGERAIDEFIESTISALPLRQRYGLEGMDILWVVLAVGSAFGIARRGA